MNEVVLVFCISVMAFSVVYALFAAERRLTDVQSGLEDLITVMVEKNALSETILELGATAKDLADKNDTLYRMLIEKSANGKVDPNDDRNEAQ